MFDFGFSEMMIVGVVALVVLGPERLPVVARTAGEWIGKAQRFVAQVKSDIDRETDLSELKKIQEQARALATDVKSTVEKAAGDIEENVTTAAGEVESAVKDVKTAAETAAGEAAEAAGQTTAAVQRSAGVTAEDLSSVYGWGSAGTDSEIMSPSTAYGGWSEPKTFAKRYHSGPSVDDLAAEIERLRRELGMRETNLSGVSSRRRSLAPRAKNMRPRIYR